MSMQYRNLGKSGLKVSLLGLGGNNFGHRMDLAATKAVVRQALELGVTLFDTADVYGGAERYGDGGRSEQFLGEALGARRKEVVIATKFGLPMTQDARPVNASRAYVLEAAEASLRRLGTDYIDLFFLHKPDPETPIEETLEALTRLVAQGKVRCIGCSNLPAGQLAAAQRVAREKGFSGFAVAQEQYSLLARQIERELAPVLAAEEVGLIPYFPLASGMLTGKYGGETATGRLTTSKHHAERFMNAHNLALTRRLEGFATARGHSLLELAFGWLAARPAVCSIIAGASSPGQLRTNAEALGWALSGEVLCEVDRVSAEAA